MLNQLKKHLAIQAKSSATKRSK